MWTSFETERQPSAQGNGYVARIPNERDKPVKGVRIPQEDPRDRPGTNRPHLAISPDRYLVEYDQIRMQVVLTFNSPITGEVAL